MQRVWQLQSWVRKKIRCTHIAFATINDATYSIIVHRQSDLLVVCTRPVLRSKGADEFYCLRHPISWKFCIAFVLFEYELYLCMYGLMPLHDIFASIFAMHILDGCIWSRWAFFFNIALAHYYSTQGHALIF